MREKITLIIDALMKRGRITIQRRVLNLVLLSSIVTFLALALISLAGMLMSWFFLNSRGNDLVKGTTEYVQNFAEDEAKTQLFTAAKLRAQLMNHTFGDIAENVQIMSDELSAIMTAPENHLPRQLPNALYETVYSATPYIHYSPELLANGLTDEILYEIGIASNFADISKPLSEFYTCAIIGSKKGYTVTIDVMPENDPVVPLSREPARSNYDPRTKTWYLLGETVDKPTFTDIYIATGTNKPCISCVMPYYDKDGFAGVVALDRSIDEIYKLIRGTKIGKTGFCFILNEHGDVLYSTQEQGELVAGMKNLTEDEDEILAETARRMVNGESDVVFLDFEGDDDYYVAFAPLESIGWSLGTVISKYEVNAPANVAGTYVSEEIEGFQRNFGSLYLFLLIVTAILIALVLMKLLDKSVKMTNRFVAPINELSNGVREIASGNLDKKLDIHTGDEIEHLATCFNEMSDELKLYMANLTKVTAEKERIATELNVATNIQAGMLPRDFDFDRADFEIYATMTPAKEVGGDFYDFYLLDENHLVITIADVSGKSVPAALFMMTAKTILKNFAMTMTNPDDLEAVMTLANQQLCENNDEMMFVTTFIGLLDLKTGEFVYVNGGHNPPLICHDGKFSYVEVPKSFVVGVNKFAQFKQLKLDLSAGDMIFLYTDGVTEAMNEAGEQYTPEHLEEVLNGEDATESLTTLLDNMKKSVKEHAGDAEQSDDITMLAVRFNGK